MAENQKQVFESVYVDLPATYSSKGGQKRDTLYFMEVDGKKRCAVTLPPHFQIGDKEVGYGTIWTDAKNVNKGKVHPGKVNVRFPKHNSEGQQWVVQVVKKDKESGQTAVLGEFGVNDLKEASNKYFEDQRSYAKNAALSKDAEAAKQAAEQEPVKSAAPQKTR
jgi:hypothetical protein